ncbi:hypothetical protein [Streptomyces mirabilis]|uniref:hypothetical protein n=1 Tax=Streptomyces mirabilis TaxID=68239 RepID=UPI003253BC81
MRDQEIQMLVIGIAAGMDLMLLVQMVFAILDDRRDRKAARRQRRIDAADRFRHSLRRYHRQQRSQV